MTLLKGDILLIFCFPIFAVLGQVIQIHPTDRKVFIDDDDGAFFSCITRDSSTSHWRLNETDYDDLPTETRDDLIIDTASTVHSQLIDMTIPARAKYNGTRVQCVAESDGGNPIVSDTATLRMQGLLASVGSFIVNYGVSSIIISWSAPFSLDVTGVDPDIKYSVLIYNVTDNPTAIPCTDCINITETHYTFTPDYPSPCHKYIFTVIPLNGAGQGHSRNISAYIFADEDLPDISFTRIDIQARNDDYCNVEFKASEEYERVCNIRLHGDGVDETIEWLDDDTLSFTLPANQIYSTSFDVNSDAGPITGLSPNHFTTYDVQNPEARESEDGIMVTGEFITDSRARGCFIVITSYDDTADVFRALQRKDSSETHIEEIINVPPSTYTVYAYDIEENALPNPFPANTTSSDPITITTSYHETERTSSVNASIFQNGSEVFVTCQFPADYPEASCVLVYREYGNTTLGVRVYNGNTTFPITITGENYTFAVFGRSDSHIDRIPVASERIVFNDTGIATVIFEANRLPEKPPPSPSPPPLPSPAPVTSPPPPDDPKPPASSSAAVIITVMVVVMVIVMAATLVLLTVVCLLRGRRKNKKRDPNTSAESGIPGSNGLVTTTIIHDMMSSDDMEETEEGLDRQSEGSVSSPTPLVSEESKYARVEAVRGPRPPPSLDQRVEYEMIDLKATKRRAHPQGLLYAELPGNRGGVRREGIAVDGLDTVQYATVLPHSVTTPTTTGNKNKRLKKKSVPKRVEKVLGPPTVEEVVSLLYEVAGQWKEIAAGLGFDEDMIDEIFTNNQTDELCLRHMVEIWVHRLAPSWETLSLVLRDMGRNDLAHKAWSEDEAEKTLTRQTSNTSASGFLASVSKCESYGDGGSEVVVGVKRQTPPTYRGGGDGTRGGKETVSGDSSVEERPGCQSMPVNPEIECSMCIEEDEEEVDNENGNTETELCVEPVSCSEDEGREEREAHVVVFGGTTYRLSKCRDARIYEEPPHASDRATDSSMRAVNSMKNSADHAFLHLQLRAKLSDTDNSGSETYREMIAPSFSAEHYRYEQGMMVTGEDYVRSADNDGDLQPRPQPAETTPSQPQIPEATPTQPHPPPENTPPLPPPYLMKIMTASAEEMPSSQKPDPPGPDNFKEMEKWVYWDCSGVKTNSSCGGSHYEPPPPLTLRLSGTL